MSIYQVKTFSDIVSAIMEELGVQSTDTVTKNRIKRDVNAIYLDEIYPAHRWWWVRKHLDLQHDVKFATGTASVTQNSRTVTLTETPAISYKGAWFNVKGEQERYKIRKHTAATSTLELEVDYTGDTNTTRTFTIWRDTLPLPPDCNEVINVTHDHHNIPVEAKGIGELRRIIQVNPLSENRPKYYSTTDYILEDPFSAIASLPASATRTSNGLLKTIKFASSLGATTSSLLIKEGDFIKVTGASHTSYNTDEAVVVSVSTTTNTNDTITYVGNGKKVESAVADTGITVQAKDQPEYGRRYREIILYPAVYSKATTLHVDYVREIAPLENDDDEPVIPLQDRMVLVYGALARSWPKQRNPEEGTRNQGLYNNKLASMMGKTEDSPEKPQIKPSGIYLNNLRRASRVRNLSSDYSAASFGSSGGSTPTGTADRAAIFDSDGRLVSSPTISSTELSYLDGARSNLQDQIDNLGFGGAPVGNRVLVTNPVGSISESTITSTELTFLSEVDPVASVTFNDNSAATPFASWSTTSYLGVHIIYVMTRAAGQVAGGIINIVAASGSAAIAQGGEASLGALGVTLTADVSSGTFRLLYATTATGSNATFKYKVQKWLQ